MISGGKGGAHTLSGLHFESRIDLADVLAALPGYSIKGDKVLFQDNEVGRLLQKNKIYVFLNENKVNWSTIISSRLLPDDAILVYHNKTVFIIEKKFQQVPGSVDEKLQTCDFKKKQYSRLFAPLNIKVEYFYVLNSWFKDKRYEDVLTYITDSGCRYFFDEIPLKEIGLPSGDDIHGKKG